jgi:lambda repressor-like predicted transcriptional regulator
MKPIDIQYAIRAAGSSQAQIARDLQVSKVTVSYVLAGKTTSRRVAEAIARASGLSLDTLWPGKYPTTQEAA